MVAINIPVAAAKTDVYYVATVDDSDVLDGRTLTVHAKFVGEETRESTLARLEESVLVPDEFDIFTQEEVAAEFDAAHEGAYLRHSGYYGPHPLDWLSREQ